MRLRMRLRQTARMAAKLFLSLVDRDRPLLAHIIPMRRCNLSCAYCNEYDAVSAPVPIEVMLRRIDLLAELGTGTITISGGEPLMHPELEAIVARIRKRGMIATLITNGYYLSRERIERLNRAGLDHLQISVDNVEPDEVSKKSLRLLEPKLQWLAAHARFTVAINSVIGSRIRNPEDALAVARRAQELGFANSLGIVHDGAGQLRPLGEREMDVYRQLRKMASRWSPVRFNASFQDKLARGLPNEWSCRAGSRYLYVDETGTVSYCSQQRGSPGIPLEAYNRERLRLEFDTRKPCAPYCTVNCVQQVAFLDRWRSPQREAALPVVPPAVTPAPAATSGDGALAG
jgi:MoaA/NifB/PqqE/SkfB family radical SAM enzyme